MARLLLSPNAAGELYGYENYTKLGHHCFFLNGSDDPVCLTPQGSCSGVRAYLPQHMMTSYFLQAIDKVHPDAVLIDYCSGSIGVVQKTIPILRQQYGSKLKIITYDGDSTEITGIDHKHKIEPYVSFSDINFFVDEDMVSYARDRGVNNCRFIRQPGVTDYHKKIEGMEKIYDASFIGSAYNKMNSDGTGQISRVQMLHYLHTTEPSLNLCFAGDPKYENYGKRFWGADTRAGVDPAHGVDLWFVNANLIYNQSKVVLCNDASTATKFMSVRLPNALLSGSMVLTRYNKGYEELFENKKHLVWFDSVEECRDLLNYYLNHEEEREQIAADGRNWVVEQGFTREGFCKTVDEELRKIL